ncbi:hypothetical protein CTI55_26450 (plasmid) [Klebsiella pneumoniae]|nr:hypothetical protein CTI55_26450 [Klebsiella pneumoniae]ATR07577.1 hypothetical protein CTI56_27830 [Klebsiella pneumoniae]ATR18686.1 hypothetical protein CTI58_27730 [Klebsiella pneumoniae]
MYSSITISSSNFSNTWISLLKNLTSSLSSKQYSRRSLSKRSFLLILSFVIRFAILYFSFSWLLGYQQFFLVAVPTYIILIEYEMINRILYARRNCVKGIL